MKRSSRFIMMVCTSLFLSGPLLAQEVASSAGSTFYIEGYQVAWTLGETAVQTFNDAPFVVTEGFHQPLLLITAVPDEALMQTEISVYPNPTNDKFTISMGEPPQQKTVASLYDGSGKHISSTSLENDKTIISMSSLPAGIYSLTVIVGTTEKQQFKIIKTLK